MFATCPNCSKHIRTANGMAFHASWCKPAQPVQTVRSQAVESQPVIVRHAETVAPSLPVVAPEPVTIPRVSPAPYVGPETVGDTSARRDDAGEPDTQGPALAHDFGDPCSCADCAGPEPTIDYSGHDYRPIARGGLRPCPACDTLTDDHGFAKTPRRTVVDYSAPMPAGFVVSSPFGPIAGIPAEPVRKARKAAPVRKAPADPFQVGPVRVLTLTAEEVAYVEKHTDYTYSPLIGDTLRAKYTRCPHPSARVVRVADPLATAAAPVIGWRAPVSGYPTISYGPGAERSAGDKRPIAPCSSYPRLEAMHATVAERKATRHVKSRPAWRGVADPLATAQRPPAAGLVAGSGRPMPYALALAHSERDAIRARASFVADGTRDLAA